MFGCHSCGKRPQKDEPYEKTPCARCRAKRDPALLSFGTGRDPAEFIELQELHPAYRDDPYDEPDDVCFNKDELFAALSQTIRVLLQMKERNPETYRVVEAKMAEPRLSYSQLAEKLSCRKQNIQYHLKRAIRLCPELGCALLIDSRRTGGRDGLRREYQA
ncbi:MAG: helix-turn-helix transcriptional regulator [Lentisphaeria bacterium]|nr:helix-turn-helix transcriptional regulator [Lentisphaeria bacterium]